MQRRLCEMSEAKWSITEAKCLQISHNKYASQRDAISHSMGNLMLSHSAGMHNTDKSIAGISKRFHFASLISHNLRCIPAYTHLIPTGFFQSSLNNHRDNFYIFFYAPTPSAQKKPCPFKNHQFCTKKMQLSSKTAFF